MEPPQGVEIPEAVRTSVRSLLRWGGHKPSGRGRPASESLLKALKDERWPTIHPLVDAANVASVRNGVPLSVLDAAHLTGPLTLRIGGEEESYVFNPSGQVLKLKGLLLVADSEGPVGTPVKDCQRTKVSAGSEQFFVLVWGTSEAAEACQQAENDLSEWCGQQGVEFQRLTIE